MYLNRILEDLTPQYGDTICQWGGEEGPVSETFRKRRYKITVNNEDRMWLPVIPKEQFYVLSYSWVLDKVPLNYAIPSLQEIKAHTTDIAWFTILPNEERPKSYWAAAFARVFPRFQFSEEHGRLFVRAFPEARR